MSTATITAPAPAPVATPTAEVPADHFVRALENVLLAACKDSTLSALKAVHVRYADGRLTLSATDRYILIREWVPATAEPSVETFEALIPAEDVKSIVSVIGRRQPFALKVEYTTTGLSVTSHSTTVHVRRLDERFPSLESFFQEMKNEPRDFSLFGIAPEFLGKLGKLKAEGKNLPVRFQLGTGAHRPVTFSHGEYISGVVMPIQTVG